MGDCSVSQRRVCGCHGCSLSDFGVQIHVNMICYVVMHGRSSRMETYKAPQHRAMQRGEKDRLSVLLDPFLSMIPALTFLEAHKQHLHSKPLTFPEYCDALEANPLNLLDPISCITVDAT